VFFLAVCFAGCLVPDALVCCSWCVVFSLAVCFTACLVPDALVSCSRSGTRHAARKNIMHQLQPDKPGIQLDKRTSCKKRSFVLQWSDYGFRNND
jgi:hypothetical protein